MQEKVPVLVKKAFSSAPKVYQNNTRRFSLNPSVCQVPGRESKHGLVEDVEHLLLDWPSPRWGPDTRPVLERLIDQQADAGEDEIGKGATDAVEGHEAADPTRHGAFAVMHRHVEMEDLRVRPGYEAQ